MKHPTMEDVAREAGVSRALVSLVFRGSPRVSQGRRTLVMEAAERLGYRPNAMARGLASRARTTVGVLIKDLHNPFFAEIVDGIEVVAESEGMQLLLGHGGRTNRELAVLDSLLEFRPAGLILLSPDAPSASIAELVGGLPVLVVGRPVRQRGMDTVVNDDALGAALAVEHLAGLGHRRIAHISGGEHAGGRQRVRGYTAAMTALGLERHLRIIDGEFTEQDGVEAASRFVAEGLPTAVTCANDLVALGLLAGFADAGVRVPDDVSVVGYDNTALARMRHVDLTTIDQPRHEMGQLALTTLMERISGERTRSVMHKTNPTLIARRTSAPPQDALETSRAGTVPTRRA